MNLHELADRAKTGTTKGKRAAGRRRDKIRKMYRRIAFVFVFLSVLINHSLYSQSIIDKVRETTYQAYVKGELKIWEEAESIIDQEYSENPDSCILYELLIVKYAYAAFCVKEKYKVRGLAIITEGEDMVKVFLDTYPDDPGVLAIKAAFMIFEANLVPAKMLGNGAASIKISEKAFQLDGENLLTLTGRANQLRFTPAIFGGSVDKSIPLYQKIISYYDAGIYQKNNDWIYINTMVILAGAYEKKKMYEEACQVYEKILLFDSDINWINNSLYPICLEKAGRSVPAELKEKITSY